MKSTQAVIEADDEILYPDSDGKPMADNTKQFEIIVTLQANIKALFANDPKVFVAGDLLWYPVKGNPKIRIAPDVIVAFGRPKGHRGSYKQWEEGGIAPQVAFEILSPGNTPSEMKRRRRFYEKYGVVEYYEHDPDHGTLEVWIRDGAKLKRVNWSNTSPLLKITMKLEPDGELTVTDAVGNVFTPPDEMRRETLAAKQATRKEKIARKAAEQNARELDQAKKAAEQHARELDLAKKAAEEERNRLAAKLRELGIEPGDIR